MQPGWLSAILLRRVTPPGPRRHVPGVRSVIELMEPPERERGGRREDGGP